MWDDEERIIKPIELNWHNVNKSPKNRGWITLRTRDWKRLDSIIEFKIIWLKIEEDDLG